MPAHLPGIVLGSSLVTREDLIQAIEHILAKTNFNRAQGRFQLSHRARAHDRRDNAWLVQQPGKCQDSRFKTGLGG